MTDTKEPVEEAKPSPSEQETVETTQPIIVDLGRQRRKRIRALKRGGGRLMDEVLDAVDQVRTNLGDEAQGKTLVPVVLIYRRRQRRRKRKNSILPF